MLQSRCRSTLQKYREKMLEPHLFGIFSFKHAELCKIYIVRDSCWETMGWNVIVKIHMACSYAVCEQLLGIFKVALQ